MGRLTRNGGAEKVVGLSMLPDHDLRVRKQLVSPNILARIWTLVPGVHLT